MASSQPCSPTQLFNSLLWDYLIIDLRPIQEYDEGHFDRAQPLQDGVTASASGLRPFEAPELADHIYLYAGEDGGDGAVAIGERVMQAVELCLRSFRRPRDRQDVAVYWVSGGYPAIQAQFPFACTSSPECVPGAIYPQVVAAYAAGVIAIAGQGIAADTAMLRRLGITHVVNCTTDVTNYAEGQGVVYHRVRIEDEESARLGGHLPAAVAFIQQAHRQGGSVLVHCMRGVSRSAAVVVACIVAAQGLTVNDAVQALRESRDICRPNAGFMRQLCAFQQEQAAAAIAR